MWFWGQAKRVIPKTGHKCREGAGRGVSVRGTAGERHDGNLDDSASDMLRICPLESSKRYRYIEISMYEGGVLQ